MNENQNQLTIFDDNGNEILCEILFTFDSEEYNKSYVLYVPVETKDDEEDVEVLCSAYVPEEDGSVGQLLPIENDDEWAMVEEIFNTYLGMDEDFDEDDEDCDDDCCCGHHHHDEDEDEDDHECGCGHNHNK